MSIQFTVTTRGERETEDLGERLAGSLMHGSAVLLYGGLGAGKTVVARGIARGLGVEEVVSSPTFVIMNRYETDGPPMFHFDLYRKPSPEEFGDLGFEDILAGSEGVAVIEWAENLPRNFRANAIEIHIDAGTEQSARVITISAPGKLDI